MKKAGILLITATLALSISGCNKTEPEKTPVNITVNDDKSAESKTDVQEEKPDEKAVDAKSLAEALKNEIAYKDELSLLDLETAGMFFMLDGIEIDEAYVYESSGATAEEIVVFMCSDEANAKKAMQVLDTRVSEQMDSYESYVPEEMVKLKAAVMEQKGNVAILSVSDEPDKAKSIIGK